MSMKMWTWRNNNAIILTKTYFRIKTHNFLSNYNFNIIMHVGKLWPIYDGHYTILAYRDSSVVCMLKYVYSVWHYHSIAICHELLTFSHVIINNTLSLL